MPLSDGQSVLDQFQILHSEQRKERDKLDVIRRYWKGKQDLPLVIGATAPREVQQIARVARVNILGIIVDSLAQSLFVDGLQAPRKDGNVKAWEVWQRNRFDRGQSGVHRAGVAYGTSYVVVTPSKNDVPVIRGVSPRRLTALYGEDPDWPVYALEDRLNGSYQIYDDTNVYFIGKSPYGFPAYLSTEAHGMGFCPVVRFRDEEDLDIDDDIVEADDEILLGQIAPMKDLQDQINLTSFDLLISQHYGAFRQRYLVGKKLSPDESVKAAASTLWTFDENPEELNLGEFAETNLQGYIESRETATKYAATISQTPVHELIGELVNLSAEAIVAALAGRDRKVNERQTNFGESWEQVFQLVGDIPNDAEVRWRDTSARAFGAVVDGLGKLSAQLNIPPRALWERVPNVTDTEIKRWEEEAAKAPPAPPRNLNDVITE